MKFSKRTWVGVILVMPMLALVLGMFACLPAPVGDPEKSKVDDKFLGVWQPEAQDANSKSVVVLKKWDAKTYLLLDYSVKTTDGKTERDQAAMKGWLTTIGGATFMVLEP